MTKLTLPVCLTAAGLLAATLTGCGGSTPAAGGTTAASSSVSASAPSAAAAGGSSAHGGGAAGRLTLTGDITQTADFSNASCVANGDIRNVDVELPGGTVVALVASGPDRGSITVTQGDKGASASYSGDLATVVRLERGAVIITGARLAGASSVQVSGRFDC